MPPSGDPFGELGERPAEGSLAVVLGRGLQLSIMLGSTMVLARLLTPSDFGLVAMAAVLSGFVGPFRDFGLPIAIVREDRMDDEKLSRIFWLNAKLAAGLALLMAAASPLLAGLFGEPDLVAITCVIAAGMAFNGLSRPHLGLLRRQMRFRVLGGVDAGSTLVGSVCGIGAALLGAGFWALVVQQLAELCTQGVVLWWVSGWRPGSFRSYGSAGQEMRGLLSFGRDTTIVRMLNEGSEQLDRALVGSLAGAAQLGFYQTARRWSELPALQLVVPIKSVAVASFSRLRHDPERYRAAAPRAFAAAFAAVLPVMAFLCVRAEDVILVLVGAQWLPAIPLFQVLCIAASFRCVSRLTVWVYLAEGETRRRLRWTLISRPLTIVAVVVGAAWDPMGIALAYTAISAALAYPGVRFCLQTSPLREVDFWRSAWRPACSSVAAGAILFFLLPLFAGSSDVNAALRLLAHGGIFALSYTGVWLLLPGGVESARDLQQLFGLAVRSGRRQADGSNAAATAERR